MALCTALKGNVDKCVYYSKHAVVHDEKQKVDPHISVLILVLILVVFFETLPTFFPVPRTIAIVYQCRFEVYFDLYFELGLLCHAELMCSRPDSSAPCRVSQATK